MGDLPLLKLLEVLGVVAAGSSFVWWQLRDVKRAQEASRREREARERSPETTSAPQAASEPSEP